MGKASLSYIPISVISSLKFPGSLSSLPYVRCSTHRILCYARNFCARFTYHHRRTKYMPISYYFEGLTYVPRTLTYAKLAKEVDGRG